ncbi:protein-tyrosine phosphatase-like protein [Emericellopsis atlantica]|uniref:phosphatidylinositol-3,4,5-trisphosphate 3-phosphatase n=1 Tax=Emericellopsis atlantica TaxID=2614577 RepID=A0A9P7ZJN6_9HYPO|nr:protein-tyrosine phosphatase-like protein [Emericellopsis atlantica]KAG9252723.1 protein-tyrosine phosphatase-like protein [Emericellopsis atlantica]
MASILRQIVAGPRARHADSGLDLSYITDYIIATSGPSQTYPQRAYRNPLDHLVAFLDEKHGDNWAIWEFRAEGTGYPDDLVYNRIRHYPWPDHHPPPFRMVPMIMGSMRNWLHGGDLDAHSDEDLLKKMDVTSERNKDRVVVVHCKAGKGRSGSMSCSYLISEEGWTAEDALARFTARRMRPQFGAGVSIPSQLRWVAYVDQWTKNGKQYIDRPIEIVEVHVWGLRNGVKVDIEGFKDEGKKISTFHTFTKDERVVVEGDAPPGPGLSDVVWEMAGYAADKTKQNKAPEEAELSEATNPGDDDASSESKEHKRRKRPTELIKMASSTSARQVGKLKSMTFADQRSLDSEEEEAEPGGMAVILKPKTPVRIPTSDVNISVERRNKTNKSMGLTMVTAVGHVWFNVFFEGQRSENDNKPDTNGVFSIDWDAMDGIKGTSRKGARALDRLAVVWRVAGEDGESVVEPELGTPIAQNRPAPWTGEVDKERDLGLRVQSPDSKDVSEGSSVKSASAAEPGESRTKGVERVDQDSDVQSIDKVRSSGPTGDILEEEGIEGEDKAEGGGQGDIQYSTCNSNAVQW